MNRISILNFTKCYLDAMCLSVQNYGSRVERNSCRVPILCIHISNRGSYVYYVFE
eukprot:COSAG02_NODE_39125_length_420_cov_2.953271_1_plen_54_part_01